jgi:hypothetical protein
MHKFVGTWLAEAAQTLVRFARVASSDNIDGCRIADKFRINVVVRKAAAESYIISLYLQP